jgi:hypothetical protein
MTSRPMVVTRTAVVRAQQTGPLPPAPGATPVQTPMTPPPMPPVAQGASFGKVMSFDGTGPEIMNGRLAMVGFVAAAGAELSTGEPIMEQFAQQPTAIAIAFTLVIAASLIPLFMGVQGRVQGRSGWNPQSGWTQSVELMNGRAAMLGFVCVLVAERLYGDAYLSDFGAYFL